MRQLVFDVNGMTITKNPKCNFEKIAAGTENYLVASFNFNLEWKGFGKVAVFKKLDKEHYAILKNNKCIIPKEALDWDNFKVSVVGSKNNVRLTTNEVKVEQERISNV